MIWHRLKSWLGLGEGGAVRNAVETLWSGMGLDRHSERTPAHQRTAFTIAFVALAAKMTKADGVTVGAELEAFERCFHVPPAERDNIRRVFNLAKQDTAGYERYAAQLAKLLSDDRKLLIDVFECLFHVASADGLLHDAEAGFLEEVARQFALSEVEYQRVRRLFVIDPDDPYRVLGLEPGVSDEALKARHRELVRENHPDTLAADGVPEEYRVYADRKLAHINAAYDRIRTERGLKRAQPFGEEAAR
ncbi:MAG: TerB family tellurite resistance protein [Pseudomonadota bacterium]